MCPSRAPITVRLWSLRADYTSEGNQSVISVAHGWPRFPEPVEEPAEDGAVWVDLPEISELREERWVDAETEDPLRSYPSAAKYRGKLLGSLALSSS